MKLFKWIKKHWVISLILALVIAGVVYQITKPETPPEIITETVSRSTLFQTVDISGEVVSRDKVELAFETSGPATGVFVREGDVVGAGQVLATIDTLDLFIDPFSATNAIRHAESVLEGSSTSVSSPSAIASADSVLSVTEVTFQNAKTDLELAKSLQEITVSEAQTSLTKAENDLAQTTLTQTDSEKQIQEDFSGILQGAVIAARSSLDDADEVLGVTNTLANDDFEDILSLTNGQILTDAENYYRTALNLLSKTETSVFSLTTESGYEAIDAAISETQELLSETALTLLYTHRALDATIVDSADFSFTDLATKKTGIDTARDLVRAEQDAIETQVQLRDSSGLSNTQTIVTKQDALATAEQTLAKTIAQQNSNVSSAKATLASARASLEQKIVSTYETISTTQGLIRASEIRSPISGIVTAVNIDAGEYVSLGTPVITVEGIDGGFEIVANIPESDIAKIQIDQPADVEFDAYGSKTSVPAQVSFIDPAEKVIEGVVFYEAKLFFTFPETLPLIKPGMTVDVVILTKELQDVISIPQRAVLTNNGDTYTRLKNGEEIIEQTVVTGTRGDGGRIEILEGIKEGDEIVITIKD